jgi:hypothetical protein
MPKKIIIPENQGRLPFTTHRLGSTFAIERRLIMMAGLIVAAVAILYAYFIVASVSHVAVRESLAQGNAALAGDIAVLEQDYLARGSAITEAYARSVGFVSPVSQIFLTRSPSLTLLVHSGDAR